MIGLAQHANLRLSEQPLDLSEAVIGLAYEAAVDGTGLPEQRASTVQEVIAPRIAALEAMRGQTDRYDLSVSRGRAFRPVAEGIGGEMFTDARDESIRLAAAATELAFDTRT